MIEHGASPREAVRRSLTGKASDYSPRPSPYRAQISAKGTYGTGSFLPAASSAFCFVSASGNAELERIAKQGSIGSADGRIMPQFVIERNMPGVGGASAEDLKGASQTSCGVLRDLGPEIQWVHSYVTDDKIYCVYRAPDEAIIREHAKRGGFPADSISQVRAVIDPTTAD